MRPGGAKKLQQKITASAAAIRRATFPQSDTPSSSDASSLCPPPRARLRSSSSQTSSSNSSSTASGASNSHQNTTAVTSPSPSNTADDIPKFLLVCIDGKAYKTLPELRYVDVSEDLNDDQLLKGILEQYEEARKSDQWTISLLVPAWIRKTPFAGYLQRGWNVLTGVVKMPRWLEDMSWPSWLSLLASEVGPGAPLHVLDTADFVRVSQLTTTNKLSWSDFMKRLTLTVSFDTPR